MARGIVWLCCIPYWPFCGVIFVALKFGTGGGILKYLCLVVGVGRKDVEMLIYASILESEGNLISSNIRVNN